MNFAAADDQLRRPEYARLAATTSPILEAMRTLTLTPYREQIALMRKNNRSGSHCRRF
jgi:hypothetical protein